jgi:glucose-1-phosphate adenylyltransferase
VDHVVAVILGGGRGSRLFPLTLHRSKPAVPIAGKYRLIDIPVSNCLNNELRRIFVLTQYNSESLNKHLTQTYKFDLFSSGFVSLLAAEQTEESPEWFQGTADAVRQSARHLNSERWREVVILAGDQLYQMDLGELVAEHRQSAADVTVAVTAVPAEQASGFGILKMDAHGQIVRFDEKPPPDRLPELASEIPGSGLGYVASMGIYVFGKAALEGCLDNTELVDFGRHVIPYCVPRMRVQAHVHRGYWEDVGTIRSYYQANLALCLPVPPFDFYDFSRPVYTHPRFLPATKVEDCQVKGALLSDGCIVVGSHVERSVIGIRSRIGPGCHIEDSLMLGADHYETLEALQRARSDHVPPVGIGPESVVRRAIVDKNARIGAGVRILNEAGAVDADGDGWYVRDGIVVVPKNAVIPDGTVI